MDGPARPSRNGFRAGLGVLAAIGVLLVVGRLSPVARQASSPLDGDEPAAPPRGGGVEFDQPVSGLVANGAAVWVAHGTTVERLDPRTLRVTATTELPAIATAVRSGVSRPVRGLATTTAGDVIWVSLANPIAGLVRIDAASARVVAVLPVASVGPAAVSSAGSAAGVWVVCCGGETYLGPGRLLRLDPATNRVVANVALPGLPDAVGVGPSGVWVRAAAGPVWRVDPATNRVVAKVTIPHGLSGTRGSVLVGQDAVWVSDPASRTVVRIDPRSNRVAGRVEVGGSPLAAAADGTVVAVSGGSVLGLGRGTVHSAQVVGLNGEYATALAAVADRIWIAESDALLHVDWRELR